MGRSIYQVNEGVLERPTISKRLVASAMAVVFVGSVMASFAASAATTVVVTPENTQGWAQVPATAPNTNGSVTYTEEFGAPEGFGTGTLKIETSLSSDKAQYFHGVEEGTTLAEISDIAYQTYRSGKSTGNANQVAAINVGVDKNGGSLEDGDFTTLVFEPVYQTNQGALVNDTWQSWDGGNESIWWSSAPINGAPNRDSFVSLADIKAANPDATVLYYGVNQGSGNSGIVSAVDALTFNGNTYDFESAVADDTAPDVAVTSPEDGARVSGIVNLVGKVTDENPMNSYFRISGHDGYVETSLYKDSRTTHEFAWDTTALQDGEYQIRFEARDQAGNKDAGSVKTIRVIVDNVAEVKDDCKNGGWENYGFKNQGLCIASLQSNSNSAHNTGRR